MAATPRSQECSMTSSTQDMTALGIALGISLDGSISPHGRDCLAYAPKARDGSGNCSRSVNVERRKTRRVILARLLMAVNRASAEKADEVNTLLKELTIEMVCSPRHVNEVKKDGRTYGSQIAYIEELLHSRLSNNFSATISTMGSEDFELPTNKEAHVDRDVIQHSPDNAIEFQSDSKPKRSAKTAESTDISQLGFEKDIADLAIGHLASDDAHGEDVFYDGHKEKPVDGWKGPRPHCVRPKLQRQEEMVEGVVAVDIGRRPITEPMLTQNQEAKNFEKLLLSEYLGNEALSPESNFSLEPAEVFDQSMSSEGRTPLSEYSDNECSYHDHPLQKSPLAQSRYRSRRDSALIGDENAVIGFTLAGSPEANPSEVSVHVGQEAGLPYTSDEALAIEVGAGAGTDHKRNARTAQEGDFMENESVSSANSQHNRLSARISTPNRRHSMTYLTGRRPGQLLAPIDNGKSSTTNDEGKPKSRALDLEDGLNTKLATQGSHNSPDSDEDFNFKRDRFLYSLRSREERDMNRMVFAPWEKHNKKTYPVRDIVDKMRHALNLKTETPGYIYCFSESSVQGFLKIGYAKGEAPVTAHQLWIHPSQEPPKISNKSIPSEVKARVEKWKRDCHYDLNVEFFAAMPCAVVSMESLIHLSLHLHHRRVKRCKRIGCKVEHREWYEVSKDVAINTIRSWERFSVCMPFTQSGMLRDFWKDESWCMIKELVKEDFSVNDWMQERLEAAIAKYEENEQKIAKAKRDTDLVGQNFGTTYSLKYVPRRSGTFR